MASLCDTTCAPAAGAPTAYDDTCLKETRLHGAEYFFTVSCDLALDITDATAVAAAITAGDLQRSPRGKLLKNRGDESSIDDAYGCGDPIQLGYDVSLAYSTYHADKDGVSDYTYWASINDSVDSLRFFWVDCNGAIHHDTGAANPGFKAGISERFEFVEGEENYGKWEGSLVISDLTASIIPLYDTAVLNALGVSVNAA